MSTGFSDLSAQKAMDEAPRISVGQHRVRDTGGAAHDETVKGYVTHVGLSKAKAESTARQDGAAYLGAHSAIRLDEDGTYSVLRIDTRETPAFRNAQDRASASGGVAAIMTVHDSITDDLRSSTKADPGFTFVD